MQFIERLKVLYQNQKLAHFYVLQMQGQDQQAKTIQALAQSFSIKTSGNSIEHPDFLTLRPEGKSYLTEQADFNEYMRSWEFRPTNLNYRFFIFTDAHLISETILNKMLKQLEEPPVWSCIFFLNPSSKKLLATIESRSARFQVPPNLAPEWNTEQGNFVKWFDNYLKFFNDQNQTIPDDSERKYFQEYFLEAIRGNPWSLFENIKKNPEREQLVSQLTLHLSFYKHTKYQQVQHVLEELQACLESKAFNNSRQIRLERMLRVWQRTLAK